VKRRRAIACTITAIGGLMLVSWPAMAVIDCTVAATGVAFGVYDPLLATADDSTGTLTVTCTYASPGPRDANYTVTLSPGSGGLYSQRQMAAGASSLGYNLFRDAARTQVWGNGTGGTTIISGTISLGPGVGNSTKSQAHTLYGRAPAQQDVAPGTYNDSILVTLTF
jgi:spore coat protein U-like protein